jgi:hypothetical protein
MKAQRFYTVDDCGCTTIKGFHTTMETKHCNTNFKSRPYDQYFVETDEAVGRIIHLLVRGKRQQKYQPSILKPISIYSNLSVVYSAKLFVVSVV